MRRGITAVHRLLFTRTKDRMRSRISGRYRADSVLLSFPSPLTQRLRVIFGLLRVFNAEEI